MPRGLPKVTDESVRKRYLGDAVYVEIEGDRLKLTTENGISVTNTIVLEPEVLVALMHYVKSMRPVWGEYFR